ncbi:MAG: RDD family protein [Rhodospirillum sp.]|nr:RDD family protein [Rhodospirillum sp.]MCF8490402.1 RDD family protein [Rhodospirillum sp.]MCF8500325.1 RDD family protein [Rhodospirillum sp.]
MAIPDLRVPDPMAEPAFYDGLPFKRVLAFGIDMICVGGLFIPAALILFMMTALSLGLLWFIVGPALGILPIAYHTLTISGSASATIGQRVMGMRVLSEDGAPPSFWQALINALAFYILGGITAWLIVLVALFNDKRRCAHDFLAGTVVVNRLD